MKGALITAAVGTIITLYLSTYHVPEKYTDDKWDSLYMDYVTEFRKSYASTEDFALRK